MHKKEYGISRTCRLVLSLIAIYLILPALPLHAAETAWLSPTQNQVYSNGGFETNPSGAYASGGILAQDARGNSQGNRGDEHLYYGFDLSTLPDSATITGIAVQLIAYKIANNSDAEMRVMVSNSGLGTWAGTSISTGDLAAALTSYTLGGASQLWGLGVTLGADLKSRPFAIKIQDYSGNNSPKTWLLDWASVKIYYGYVSDLSISKTHPGYPQFTQGQPGAYQIVVSNTGTGATLGAVTVTDSLPPGLTATALSGTGWTCNPSTLTCTRSDALAVGVSYPPITLSVAVSTEAAPTVTNTAVVSGGGEFNTTNNTATDAVDVIQLVPNLNATKSVTDENGGNLYVNEYLLYTIVIQNPTGGHLTGAAYTDDLPANVLYVDDSATAPSGASISYAAPTLTVTGINVPAHSQATITYKVRLIGTGPANAVINQGLVAFDTDGDGTNNGSQLTDGDTIAAGDQETIIPVSTGPAPNFSRTTKTVDLAAEAAPIDGAFSPGDTLRYNILIRNTGDAAAAAVSFTDAIPANTAYVAGSVTATRGTPTYSGQIGWSDPNPFNPGDSVTLTFDVTINPGVAIGTVISNQGIVSYDSAPTLLTDADLAVPGKQPTNVTIGGIPRIKAVKTVTDENGGYLEPGDTLLYTIVLDNLSAYSVSGIRFTDGIPNSTAYVAGSVTRPLGTTLVTETPTLEITGMNLPANNPSNPTADQQTITFRVRLNDPLGAGVTQISNQGIFFYDINNDGTNDTTLPTDGDSTEPGYQATVISVGAAPNFEQTTKSAAIVNDADGNEYISPGDRVRYNVKIRNTGSLDATGVVFTDPVPPADTAYVSGSAAASSGTVIDTGGQIQWTGNVPKGGMVVVTFDVIINTLNPPAIGTVISNQGTVTYDAATMLTDGDYTTPEKDPTTFTIGGYVHGYGTKTATDVNGGHLEPGDTVLYTIVVHNTSGFYGSGQEFTDTIPANTTYTGTATAPPGATIVTEGPSQLKITGISVAPYSQYTITFSVRVNDTLPTDVTQISNQGLVFYDSNTDGINDTYQHTDGDPAVIGNQPTVSILYGGTISGTVFEDANLDGTLDAGESGLSGVTVELLDAFYVLLYGTTTSINGYYAFTKLPPGDYHVRETNPSGYISTSPDQVSVTLPPTSAVADFGDRPFAGPGADVQIGKICSVLYPDGSSQQLICRITVTNNGPEGALSVVLTDDFSLLVTAGLSNVTYTLDGVVPADPAWTGSLDLGDMASGTSHVIRIFADVGPGFVPLDNAALVSSANDPYAGNNTISCINTVAREGRYALDVKTGADVYMSTPGDPSVNVRTTGTIEAWIYPREFTGDAGVVMKGTTAGTACFGFGLGGAEAGGVFTDGTAQNIGFVLYDTSGNPDDKHLLTSTTTLAADRWHHVACVWDLAASPQMAIYINGIKDPAPSPSIPAGREIRVNAETVFVGIQAVTPMGFPGVIDETRIWSSARTQEQIRNTMCRKVYSSDPGYATLEDYWRFDEESGLICGDSSGNGRIGILTNAARICSSAPVGDDSRHDYTDASGFSVVFDYPAGDERLTASAEAAADWTEALKSGLQVYRVNMADEQNGPLGMRLLANVGYYGVFVTGGKDPTYRVDYEYDRSDNGIPGVGNEDELQLTWRHGNCETWKPLDATIDTVNRILTMPGQTGTEFILGSNMDPRNAVLFDGSDDYVNVPDDAALQLTDVGTLEAWIYVTAFPAVQASIISKGDINDGYDLSIDSTGNVLFSLYTSGPPISATTVTTTAPVIALNTWYHVSATWDGIVGAGHSNYMSLYINGVLDPDPATASTQVSGDTTGSPLTIGSTGTNHYFQGRIDEVRVWNIARGRDAIRGTMCRKLAGTESGLMGYWRFDEETDSDVCPDYTANDNDGTMTNFDANPTVPAGLDPIREYRVCSSAPIGDDSAFGYYDGGTLSPVTVQLAHTDGDYMEATQNTANSVTWSDDFSGIHIYRLDEAPVYPPDLWTTPDPPYGYQSPNGLTPPEVSPSTTPKTYWSSIDYYRYWGVFVTDWVEANAPVYDVIYHYAGNPLTPDIDSVVGLARRPEYCFGTWSDSGDTPDFVNDTLTVTADYQFGTATAAAANPEYVFGGKDAPLAITLASFTATPEDGCVEVAWETATEINTAGFHLWRSDNPLTGFVRVTSTLIPSKSVMETLGASYAFKDCDVETGGKTEYYYKLEEIDMDSGKDNAFYGPIGPVREGLIASQSAPKTGSEDEGACFISILSGE